MAARQPRLDDEIRDLYRGPLGAFTAGRQALAKRLRQAKDPRAAEVGKLRKPPLSVWAVNRLLAEEPQACAALVGTGERARAAQRKVMAGGDAGALRQAIESARAEIARLTERGAEILTAAERAPGEAIVERLRADLESLAFNPAAAAAAERGWLDDDLEPPGFEVLMGLQLAAASGRPAAAGPRAVKPPAKAPAREAPKKGPREAPPPPARKPATVHPFEEGRRAAAARAEAERRELRERAKAELQGAEAEASVRRREAEREERAAEQAERRAADSRQRADEAARRADQDRERAETARRAAAEARERASRAEKAVEKARGELERSERP